MCSPQGSQWSDIGNSICTFSSSSGYRYEYGYCLNIKFTIYISQNKFTLRSDLDTDRMTLLTRNELLNES